MLARSLDRVPQPSIMVPLNLCMVVNNLDVGGLEKVVINLIQELDRDAFRLFLICLDGPGKLFDQVDLPASQCLVLHKRAKVSFMVGNFDLGVARAIRRFLSDNRIDIVHAHNLAPLIYGGLAARLTRPRPRIVYTEHNQIYRANALQRRKFWFYANLADELVAVSHDLKGTLKDELHVRPPVCVVHNGIDGRRFSSIESRVRQELGIGEEEFVVGTAVVLSEQKGLTYMLQAARLVADEDESVRFVIAGDGPLREQLLREAESLALGDRVLFPGYRRDVPELISAYDVYALSSLWEGLPLALLEALAIGRPIVATTVGGNPEVVEDGVNGFLVPPRDPEKLAARILELRRDQELVDRVRSANRQRFESEFSLPCMVNHHAELFQRVAPR